MKKVSTMAGIVLLFTTMAFAQLGTTAPTNTVSVSVAAEAALTIQTPTMNLTSTGTNFSNYTGTTNFTYFIRTTASGGAGSIVLKVESDFSGSGGPSVASPPTPTDTLSYSCTVAAPATACSGPLNSSTATATNVATFGTDAHSSYAGNSGTTSWTLTNDPLYKTGSYSATVIYTVSAT